MRRLIRRLIRRLKIFFLLVIGGQEKPRCDTRLGYGEDNGSDKWGKLDECFKACDTGKYQSPIDIKASGQAYLPKLSIDYRAVALTIFNNSHTVQITYPKGSTMKVWDKVYQLKQFHFHSPSENSIGGLSYQMELHFVHQTEDGSLGVLAVMINEGVANPMAEKIWSRLPLKPQPEKTYQDITINGLGLLPQNRRYYCFMGSLTTPPYSEGVIWYVLEQPIEFSSAQIAKFRKAFPFNARDRQPGNSRQILIGE